MPPLPPPGTTGKPASPLIDLRRRAIAKLAERLDPARTRHKPLSLVRQEAKRVLEQFIEVESPTLGRPDRDRLVDEVIGDAIGYGPLEEIFRDDTVKEILVLPTNQVIVRKGDNWLPHSARFRDAEHLRATLARMADTGEQLVAGTAPVGGFDVRLPVGFRALGVIPPAVMETPPTAVFVRTAPATGGSGVVAIGGGMGGPASAKMSPVAGRPTFGGPPSTAGSMSGAHDFNPPASFAPVEPPSRFGSLPPVPPDPTPSAVHADPFAKIRQRITERIIMRFAAAGVYDLNEIALPELRKIVLAQVTEFGASEKLGLDDAGRDRLALEILAGMNR